MTEASRALVVRRLIKAPRTAIYEAFCRRELLAQWFRPSPEVSLEVLEFDFRPEGRFRLRYVMPDGRKPIVGGVYQSIEPPARIAMSWIWEAPDPLAGRVMHVHFQFFEKESSTEIVITHENSPTDTVCTIHERAWEGTLDKLEIAIVANEKLSFSQTVGSGLRASMADA